jgi:hypothetical protein
MPYDMQKQFFDPLMEMTKFPLNSVKDIVKTIPTKGEDMETSKQYVILKLGSELYIAPYDADNLGAATVFMNQFVEVRNEDGVYTEHTSSYRKPSITLINLTDSELNLVKTVMKPVNMPIQKSVSAE